MLGLGIESTCDETSLAIVEDGIRLIHCETYSQLTDHSTYRGVVPELASRAHLEKLNFLLANLRNIVGFDWKDIRYVSIANTPGLMGSLMMGAQLARSIGLVYGTPIVPVNHLESHIAAVRLEEWDKKTLKELDSFPYLAILLSGGNSSIYIHRGWGDLEIIGESLDDALGEAFDKASALLGLPYPGGPFIEKEAELFKESEEFTKSGLYLDSYQNFVLPRLLKGSEGIQFSFSGLKTALVYALRDKPQISSGRLAYEFQEVSFELVTRNIIKAVNFSGFNTVVAGGGVLANSRLRNKLELLSKEKNISIIYPRSKFLCTDNAAMVGCLGYFQYIQGDTADLDFPISPRF